MAKNRKERHRQKRQQRQRTLQRARSVSPYRRIGTRGEVLACYVNDNWRDQGMASVLCLCRVPGGGHAIAGFLVDLWCMGLKDAWGRLDITAQEFHDNLAKSTKHEVEVVRVDLEVVKRVVAGGIRFGRENGFRLPKRYERWTAMLGDLGDIESADLSDFGVDGGLRFVGNLTDLGKRLVGTTVDEFIHREDVHYIIGDDDATLFGDDEMAMDDKIDAVKEVALGGVRRWCFARGDRPAPRLDDAWDVLVAGSLNAADSAPVESLEELLHSEAAVAQGSENIERLLAFETPAGRPAMTEALAQLAAYAEEHGPEALLRRPAPDERADAR